MKHCYKCDKDKPLDAFDNNKSKPDGKATYCKECKKAYNKAHYQEHGHLWKETRAQQRDDYKKSIQRFICEYLLQHPCVDCGESDIVVLEFDHIQDKEFNISSRMTYSIKRLEAEIAKCEIRCANCHRRKTAERLGGNYKTKYMPV